LPRSGALQGAGTGAAARHRRQDHDRVAGGHAGLEALLDALGRPERGYAIAQVGGTNGKGSISALLAAMLRAEGRRVGLYTSPHLVSFRERIRVDGEAIGDAPDDGEPRAPQLFA